jgi:endonuclease YncB( thermonuclease family)
VQRELLHPGVCYPDASTQNAFFAGSRSASQKTRMIKSILFSLITLLVSLRLEAAMVRVTGVTDGQTLVVERGGVAVPVKLAGIQIVDQEGARSLLRWTVGTSWVMLEEQPHGGHFVYRSPDGLFLNRELVARGFARATLPGIEAPTHVVVTYLGTLFAPAAPPAPRSPATARNPTATGTGSARSSRSPARPSPSRRRRKP